MEWTVRYLGKSIVYTLSDVEISRFDLARAEDFVNCWGSFYRYKVKVFEGTQLIDYVTELNLGGDLTRQNLERLLRWKDPHRLTEEIVTGNNRGQRNEKVDRAIKELPLLNRFRRGEIPGPLSRWRAITRNQDGRVMRSPRRRW